LDSQRAVLSSLARLDDSQLQIARQLTQVPPQAVVVHVRGVTIYLPLAGMLDLEKEKTRVTGEIELVRAQIARSEQLLASSHERVGQLETRLAQLSGRTVEPEPANARVPKRRITKQVKRKSPTGKKPGKKHQPVKTKPRKGQRKK
jgi:valyl-tRNA synthetase